MTSTTELDYELPGTSIAQVPVEPRDAARLLVDRGPGAPPAHRTVADLPSLVGPGDLIVVNDTRVIPARLRLRKATGGAVEVLLLEQVEPCRWEALVRPGRRVPPGTELAQGDLRLVVEDDLGEGRRRVTVLSGDPFGHGRVALPPYVHKELDDPERYQTVYARRPASVAAPTAGLHLTPALLDRCRAAGAEVAAVELEVGLATFRPITAPRIEDHPIHAERFAVADEVLDRCRDAGRVLAIGTTVVRALEAAARGDDGRTELFIHGGFAFPVVDRLLTNFHVPRSSLLALVDAFVGPRWRQLYATALTEGYRFLSFGDAMLLDRRWGRAG
jgi:S-adenosylmethionine:tRNA ribosyltransferase-isomerase